MANKIIGSVAAAVDARDKILRQGGGGKAILHQQYPDEYEYYMFALELLDSNLKTKQYFIFPIMPNNMSYNDTPITKITKTAGGVSVLKSNQFIPKTFSTSGTFGRSYKVLIGNTQQELVSSFKDNSVLKGITSYFDDRIKTGYGCTKILEEIVTTSNQKDELGGAHFLVMYNLALNHKFFVEVEDFNPTMSLESNMIWNYSLRLKCIAPSDNFLKTKSDQRTSTQLVIEDQIQKNANKAYGAISNLLNKQIQKI